MLTRRDFIAGSSLAAAGSILTRTGHAEKAADYSIEIGPCTLEVSPHHTIKTTGYNGQIPGPLLRMHEGETTLVRVTNRTAEPEIVHWLGLFLPSKIDGAMEEGKPMIAPGQSARYMLNARPSGFRWYHTHTFAGNNLKKAQYGGQHGFLFVEPKNNPGRYDSEVFLALHDWDGHSLGSDDGAMNPVYDVSTINGRVLGFGEPLRVKQGQRVLMHVLNSSPTEVHWLALSGHAFEVIALDGNPVPQARRVSMLRLCPAERVSAIVTMDRPGVWVLGEVRKHIQDAGMGLVVEYAGASGKPVWQQPETLSWDYEQFGAPASAEEKPTDAEEIPLVFAAKFAGHGAMEHWTINGKSYPDVPQPVLVHGRRYRLRMQNRSLDDHPIHLHRHVFELKGFSPKVGIYPTLPARHGVMKDTVLVNAGGEAVVEFVADDPGSTLLHCHQQNHMDLGFMMLFRYA